MKYVGATDSYIRWPFVIEGVIIGLIGSIIPIAVSWPIYEKVVQIIVGYLPPAVTNVATFLTGADIFSNLIPFLIGGGILLGVVGSVSSIRKHLRV